MQTGLPRGEERHWETICVDLWEKPLKDREACDHKKMRMTKGNPVTTDK